MTTKVLVFVGGVAVGLLLAKIYAQTQVQGVIHSVLSPLGLGGGNIETAVDNLVVPVAT